MLPSHALGVAGPCEIVIGAGMNVSVVVWFSWCSLVFSFFLVRMRDFSVILCGTVL